MTKRNMNQVFRVITDQVTNQKYICNRVLMDAAIKQDLCLNQEDGALVVAGKRSTASGCLEHYFKTKTKFLCKGDENAASQSARVYGRHPGHL